MPNFDQKRPNIIFVLTDDQGYWALGCNGNKEIITPNIDRLAQEGARFENFFCASPVCSPARASLLTGRIPSQHGVHDWIREGNVGPDAIEYLQGMRGYTEDLADMGYRCALSGKWHLGDSINPQKGFSLWYTHQRGGGNYYNAPMIKNGELIEQPGYITDAITDQAIEFMDEMTKTDDPFYLSVHYTAPHSPWIGGNHPEELTSLYDDCPFESCPVQKPHPWAVFSTAPDALTEKDVQNPKPSLKGYFGAVTGVDRSVGRLRAYLEEHHLDDNTLIIFTADNGFNCGHHGIWGKGNGTFPSNMYDTSVKVPLIFWHKNVIEPKVVKNLVSAYDFMPTLLDYLGMEHPCRDELPGHSFAKLLTQNVPFDETDMVVIMDEYGPTRMIRTAVDKFVCRYPFGADEYYDLKADPDELHNRVSDPAVADRILLLKQTMERWFLKYTDPSMDGRLERVCGNGQIDRAGTHSQKLVNYEPCGYTYQVKV